jgi:hypothetical protein
VAATHSLFRSKAGIKETVQFFVQARSRHDERVWRVRSRKNSDPCFVEASDDGRHPGSWFAQIRQGLKNVFLLPDFAVRTRKKMYRGVAEHPGGVRRHVHLGLDRRAPP